MNSSTFAVPPVTPTATPTDLIGYEKKKEQGLQRVGCFILGPEIGSCPVKCMKTYLARKDNNDKLYVLKIVTRKREGEKITADDVQGTTLLHTEHQILSMLKNEKGIVQEHGLFSDTVDERWVNANGRHEIVFNVKRLFLATDCYFANDFSPSYQVLTNMQEYLIKNKKVSEADAIRIFYKVLKIVERVHELNIVHRDLKLGNIVWNKQTGDVSLATFCLGKHLSSESDLLKDQRGSPAYISPDVISGKPYLGKPSDMWALGIVLYTMIYGVFPFYDQVPTILFNKIRSGKFDIPVYVNVNERTVKLIKSLLTLNPKERMTVSGALAETKAIILQEENFMKDSDEQVVPSAGYMKRPICKINDKVYYL